MEHFPSHPKKLWNLWERKKNHWKFLDEPATLRTEKSILFQKFRLDFFFFIWTLQRYLMCVFHFFSVICCKLAWVRELEDLCQSNERWFSDFGDLSPQRSRAKYSKFVDFPLYLVCRACLHSLNFKSGEMFKIQDEILAQNLTQSTTVHNR